jgi:hypothetical protein
MDTVTAGVIFVAVWLGLVLLYCVFKACGGRVVDILSCDCCAGPCCDCWGVSGRIHEYDREYPFRHQEGMYLDPYGPYARPQPQLPPIVVVNSMQDKESRRRGNDDDTSSSDDEDSGASRKVPRDPELREEAGGALLLRSSGTDTAPGRRNQPVVI